MRTAIALALLGLAVASAFEAQSVPHYSYRQVGGKVSFSSPGFPHFFPLRTGTAKDLVITSFTGNPFAQGSIYYISNVAQAYANNFTGAAVQTLATNLAWPNALVKPDPAIFGKDGVLVFDGFLVPGKDNGAVRFVGVDGSVVTLSQPKNSFFYHFGHLVDLNGDGHLDILTARATKPLFGNGYGEMLWLQNPGANPLAGAWTEHVINKLGEVNFAVGELDNDPSTIEVVNACFFSSQLTLTVLSVKDGSVVYSGVIDNTIGAAYDVKIIDLNADGKLDLLVTNHMSTAATSAMYAYEVPADLKAKWTRHTLAINIFNTTQPGFNQASPGFPYAFRPNVTATKEPYHIMIAGDGTQSAILFRPTDQPWVYNWEVVVNVAGTVGAISIADVNGDGWSEFIVPNYDSSYVLAYTFAP